MGIIKRQNRTASDSMDFLIGQTIPVLDHGFIRVVDYMGTDDSIVQAARVSYGEGTKTPSDDRALIRYLMRHLHTTPFEMCEVKLHLKMPIFVARQWVRHRTASINEYSGRYSTMKDEFYVPAALDIQGQSTTNKQGRGGEITPEAQAVAHSVFQAMAELSEAAFKTYNWFAADEVEGPGVARELARIILPLSTYTEFYWKLDLHNLLHFLRLRMDSHAQTEIRSFANEIAAIVQAWCPIAFEAFTDYRLEAATLSRAEMEIIRALVSAADIEEGMKAIDFGLSKREQTELIAKFY